MSVTTATAAHTQRPAERDAGSRGSLEVADRVVERIAGRAVSEVDCATGAVRQVLGFSVGSVDHSTPARVTAAVDGGVVTIGIGMSVGYPASVRRVTREVRQHVQRRVAELTGLRVAEVDIRVEGLVTVSSQRRVQ